MASKRWILAALISASAFGVAAANADDANTQTQSSTGRETGGPGYGGVGGMGSIGADGDTLTQEHHGSTGVGINNGLSTANNAKGQPQEVPKAGSTVKDESVQQQGTGGSGSNGTTTSTTISTTPVSPAPVEQQDQGIGGSGSTDKTPSACSCSCSNDTGEPIPLNNAP